MAKSRHGKNKKRKEVYNYVPPETDRLKYCKKTFEAGFIFWGYSYSPHIIFRFKTTTATLSQQKVV